MIKFKKRPTPPEFLPEEVQVEELSDEMVVLIDPGDMEPIKYLLTYHELLEYYEVE